MTVTREQFAQAALLAISKPVSRNNLTSMVTWQASENTEAVNNPCATTLQYEGSTDFNEAGVKNYTTFDEGVQAWKETILNGLYAPILTALEASASPAETCSAIENSPWGSKPNSTLVGDVAQDYDKYANVAIGGSTNEEESGPKPSEGNTPAVKPILAIGSSGSEVEVLQTFLNEDCSADLAVDGEYGELTQLSVRNFQRFMGLAVDGVVGVNTWGVIDYVEALHGQQES